ncbi:hypothetical protein C1932_16430 [Stenotrophomonas sp. YAU14D1_LEIMI4_1]|nr:hypothetical protein C1932_16430 [Stenotrophomonas sp. YAU14D1_LEIMI4_1]
MNLNRNRRIRIELEKHPRMAWIYCRIPNHFRGQSPLRSNGIRPHAVPTARGNLSKAGWVRLRGRERHGWRDRGYMDVLAPSPATGPTPPSHGYPVFALAVAVAPA